MIRSGDIRRLRNDGQDDETFQTSLRGFAKYSNFDEKTIQIGDKLTWLGINSLNVKLLITEMVFQLSPCSCNANCQATAVVAHCLYLSDL